MDKFLQDVFTVIENYHMLAPGMSVIAGVSGGADSVCLLRCLLSWSEINGPLNIAVVHVEHGLRGEESLEDARFTGKLCSRYGVPFYIEHIDAAQIAVDRGMTLEEAGRYARYEIFESYRKRLHADVAATAHHAGDQAETVLMNLMRGTGLKGLGGMAPVRDHVIRPLLFETRQQIEDYLKRIGQEFKTDRTNLETEFTRNKIRLEMIPAMEREINTETVRHITMAAEKCRQAEQFLEEEASRRLKECAHGTKDGAVISCRRFSEQPPVMQSYMMRRIFFLLRDGTGLKDITSAHVESVCRLVSGRTGSRLDLPGFTAVRGYDELRIIRRTDRPAEDGGTLTAQQGQTKTGTGETVPDTETEIEIDTGHGGEYEFAGCRFIVRTISGSGIPADTEGADAPIPQKEYTKWLCCDKIKNVICIRTRRPGDYFVMDSEGNHQSLKKYMIDHKISRDRRERMPLVAEGSHILWMPDGRISEDVRVSRSMKKVLEITMIRNDKSE